MRTFELASTDLTKTVRRYVRFLSKTIHPSPSAPMIDLSTSPAPSSAFSFVALSSSSLAISLTSLVNDLIVRARVFGILVDKTGKVIPRTELSIMEKEGLIDPKDPKAVSRGEVLPSREPKSCEKPPIPMLSSLVEDDTDQGHANSREMKSKNRTSHNSSW